MSRRPGLPEARVWSLWLAIGMLVAAALLGAVFIIAGDQAGVSGRAWLTLLLAGAFAGVVLLDAAAATGPNRWYFPASVSVNSVLMIVGQLKVWGGFYQPDDTLDASVWSGQIAMFLTLVVVLRVALLITQTYGLKFLARSALRPARLFATAALAAMWIGVLLASLPLTLPAIEWGDLWWRLVGAGALVTVVLMLIPVVLMTVERLKPEVEPLYGTQQATARPTAEDAVHTAEWTAPAVPAPEPR